MICGTCKSETAHIRVNSRGEEECPVCANISDLSAGTDGLLTRTRVRADSVKHEGDMLPPYKFDKTQKKVVPNKDFIKRFPNQDSISKEELKNI